MAKKAGLVFLVMVVLFSFSGLAWAANAVTIVVNGTVLTPDVPAQIIGGKTMVPLRFVTQALGAQVGWEASTKTAIVRKDFKTDLSINTPVKAAAKKKLNLEINGNQVTDVTLLQVNGRVMVPLRVISESFGAKVDWDGKTKTVAIAFNKVLPPYEFLADAEEKLKQGGGYNVDGKGSFNFNFNLDGLNMGVKMDLKMDGSILGPEEGYVKMTMELPALLQGGAVSPGVPMVTETYYKGQHVYTRLGDGDWQEGIGSNERPFPFGLQGDADSYKQMVENMGVFLAYGPDVSENGRQYTVVDGTIDGKVFSRFLAEGLGGLIPGTTSGQSQAEDEAIQKMFETMKASFSAWVDAGTLTLAREHVDLSASMQLEEDGVQAPFTLKASFDIKYEAGAPLYLPPAIPGGDTA